MTGRLSTDADGDLLLTLDKDDAARAKQSRGANPSIGSTVTLWRLPGTWSVWSPGPETSIWWLTPGDDEARDVAELLAVKPVRGQPVVRAVWKRSIAVGTRDIRPTIGWGAR